MKIHYAPNGIVVCNKNRSNLPKTKELDRVTCGDCFLKQGGSAFPRVHFKKVLDFKYGINVAESFCRPIIGAKLTLERYKVNCLDCLSALAKVAKSAEEAKRAFDSQNF